MCCLYHCWSALCEGDLHTAFWPPGHRPWVEPEILNDTQTMGLTRGFHDPSVRAHIRAAAQVAISRLG